VKPGDVIRWQCPKFPHSVHDWCVRGVHLGAVGVESLVELESLTHKPGWTGEWESHPVLFVPEVLLRDLPIVGTHKVDLGGAR